MKTYNLRFIQAKPATTGTKTLTPDKSFPMKRMTATLSEQFIIALSITNGNILGAANLCWISTRLMARGADQRIYPSIVINEMELRQWNEKVARFETREISGKSDGPGDNYYFWTHAFTTMIFSLGGVRAKAAQLAFSKGTKIMMFARNYIARKQPNMTSHEPASSLGRKFGLAIVELARSAQQRFDLLRHQT